MNDAQESDPAGPVEQEVEDFLSRAELAPDDPAAREPIDRGWAEFRTTGALSSNEARRVLYYWSDFEWSWEMVEGAVAEISRLLPIPNTIDGVRALDRLVEELNNGMWNPPDNVKMVEGTSPPEWILDAGSMLFRFIRVIDHGPDGRPRKRVVVIG